MAADVLAIRMASWKVCTSRLTRGSVQATRFGSLETRIETRFAGVDWKLDSTFRWVIGVIPVN